MERLSGGECLRRCFSRLVGALSEEPYSGFAAVVPFPSFVADVEGQVIRGDE